MCKLIVYELSPHDARRWPRASLGAVTRGERRRRVEEGGRLVEQLALTPHYPRGRRRLRAPLRRRLCLPLRAAGAQGQRPRDERVRRPAAAVKRLVERFLSVWKPNFKRPITIIPILRLLDGVDRRHGLVSHVFHRVAQLWGSGNKRAGPGRC